MAQLSVGFAQPQGVQAFLINAQQLYTQGKTAQAYRQALEATKLSPNELNAWFWRAATAPSLEERLMCLSRVFALDPHFDPAKPHLYNAMQDLLHREPFLGYLDETTDLYRVKSGLELYLNVPKSRAVPEPYPAPQSDALRSIHQVLLLAAISLLLGGFIAIFLAPLAGLKAILLLTKTQSYRDQGRAMVALAVASLIWLASFPITWLFILHVVQ